MSRDARVVLPGIPHHVTQRGNNRAAVFFDPSDRALYLNLLREACAEHTVGIEAYCLMENHVHLVLMPNSEVGLAGAMGRAAGDYAIYANARHSRTGHLWEGRFYSTPMDDEHFWQAVRYVECNPVRAGTVEAACDYSWSSARAHVVVTGTSRLLDLAAWRERMAPDVWRRVLEEAQPTFQIERLRAHTRTGRPLGSEDFIQSWEVRLGRPLRVRPKGRPRTRK